MFRSRHFGRKAPASAKGRSTELLPPAHPPPAASAHFSTSSLHHIPFFVHPCNSLLNTSPSPSRLVAIPQPLECSSSGEAGMPQGASAVLDPEAFSASTPLPKRKLEGVFAGFVLQILVSGCSEEYLGGLKLDNEPKLEEKQELMKEIYKMVWCCLLLPPVFLVPFPSPSLSLLAPVSLLSLASSLHPPPSPFPLPSMFPPPPSLFPPPPLYPSSIDPPSSIFFPPSLPFPPPHSSIPLLIPPFSLPLPPHSSLPFPTPPSSPCSSSLLRFPAGITKQHGLPPPHRPPSLPPYLLSLPKDASREMHPWAGHKSH